MSYKVDGDIIWKSYLEYNPNGRLHGDPYYYITEINKVYYLWKFDIEKKEYVSLKSSENFNDLNEDGLKLEKELNI